MWGLILFFLIVALLLLIAAGFCILLFKDTSLKEERERATLELENLLDIIKGKRS